ncbi:MAG: putative toxin-antitoxin system toxin component, PIN family [Ginsengibacter sp.]
MPKIIVDTNILVSALIQTSYPYLIIDNFLSDDKTEFCISAALFKEYLDVLNRKRFSKYPDFLEKAKLLLSYIEKKAIQYYPVVRINLIKDLSDNKLLELADASNAEYLITGNSNDFTMRIYKGTRIISPKEYWEREINNNND